MADRSTPPLVPDDATPSAHTRHWSVSIIDLDRTLTRRGTYTPFLLHTARRVAPWRLALAPTVLLCMIAYKLGLLSRKRLKEMMHRLMIGPQLSRADAEEAASSFAERETRVNCYDAGRRLIEREKADGRIVILCTAACRLYAAEIAIKLGVDHVVATESKWDGDVLLPAIRGENCYGPEKLKRIVRYLRVLGIPRDRCDVRFYSDDVSDAPIFHWCDEPVAVNPSAKLRAMSRMRNWPIVDWREREVR